MTLVSHLIQRCQRLSVYDNDLKAKRSKTMFPFCAEQVASYKTTTVKLV